MATKNCPTCKGKGYITAQNGEPIYHPMPCPDCSSGGGPVINGSVTSGGDTVIASKVTVINIRDGKRVIRRD